MYRKNDLIVYGSTGVCRITDIAPLPHMPDCHKEYYTLIPLFSPVAEIIHVSVQTCACIRPLITAAQARMYLESLAELPATPYHSHDPKQTVAHYTEILYTHDCMQYLQMVKSIYMKSAENARIGKKISQTEQRYLKQAEHISFGELAAALDKTLEEIRTQVQEALRNVCA